MFCCRRQSLNELVTHGLLPVDINNNPIHQFPQEPAAAGPSTYNLRHGRTQPPSFAELLRHMPDGGPPASPSESYEPSEVDGHDTSEQISGLVEDDELSSQATRETPPRRSGEHGFPRMCLKVISCGCCCLYHCSNPLVPPRVRRCVLLVLALNSPSASEMHDSHSQVT